MGIKCEGSGAKNSGLFDNASSGLLYCWYSCIACRMGVSLSVAMLEMTFDRHTQPYRFHFACPLECSMSIQHTAITGIRPTSACITIIIELK